MKASAARRRVIATLAALGTVALTATAEAVGPSPLQLPQQFGGPNMVRAEAIVKRNGVVRDFRIDRGRVRAVGAASVTLRERDGLVVTLPIAASARIHVNGRPARMPALRPGMEVMTVREGDEPAHVVHAPSRPAGNFFDYSMVRAEAVLRVNGVSHDYRVDRGRVRLVTANAIVLRERDGLVVTVPVATDARIHLNRRPVSIFALRRGMEATTIRDGSQPAESVQAFWRR